MSGQQNQLSRYGAIARSLQFTPGRTLFVVQAADSLFGNFANEFPVDTQGNPRVFSTIQAAVNAALPHDVIMVTPGQVLAGGTDPVAYAETVIIPNTAPNISIIGITDGRTLGALPEIRIGSGSTAMITVRAPGVVIKNLSVNGAGSTGGGILIDDNGTTKVAFGTVIDNCTFKNCKGSTATSAKTGGAIMWAATGGGWQTLIKGNRFYDNVGDIVLLGTSQAVPQDVVITGNEFSDSATATDCNLYLAAGSGMTGLTIKDNYFGAFPALSLGATLNYMVLTGCTGTMSHNFFGSTGKTFGAAANVLVPTTVLMPGNYQESGLIART